MKSFYELWIGPAGSGKSHACLEKFRKALAASSDSGLTQSIYYILPTQEHSNRIHDLIFQDTQLKGLLNTHVLTINDFLRLKSSASQERILSAHERQRLLKQILQNNTWQWFEPIKHTKGISNLLSDFVREFKLAGGSTPTFHRLIQKVATSHPYLHRKGQDLAHFLSQYENECKRLGGVNPEDEMLHMIERLEAHESAPTTDLVIVDGFFSFNATQLRFIKALPAMAQKVIVTLTMDTDPDRPSFFIYPHRVKNALIQSGFQVRFFEAASYRFANPHIESLSQRLFKNPSNALPDTNGIYSFEAKGHENEVELIAQTILNHHKKGEWDWSDHMIVVRDLGPYESWFKTIFNRLHIPYEIHERERLRSSHLIRPLLLWMEIFRIEKIYTPNAQWQEKDEITVPILKDFLDWPAIKQKLAIGTHEEFIEWIIQYPNESSWEALEPWIQKMLQADWLALFKEYRSLDNARSIRPFFKKWLKFLFTEEDEKEFSDNDWRMINMFWSTLEEHVHEYHEKNRFDAHELLRTIQNSLEEQLYSLTDIPQNTVQIYDINLALPKEYPIVFLAGLNDGVFPPIHTQNPILNDDDRLLLSQENILLDTMANRKIGEKYFFYMAITRAQNELYFSHITTDYSGNTYKISPFLKECLEICPNITIQTTQNISQGTYLDPFNPRGLDPKSHITPGVERVEVRPRTLAPQTLSSTQLQSEAALKFLHDRQKPMSPTELTVLKNCPFQHFAKYTLKMESSTPDSPELIEGRILHKVLEEFHKSDTLQNPQSTLEEWLKEANAMLDAHFPSAGPRTEHPMRTQIRKQILRNQLQKIIHNEYQDLSQRQGLKPKYFELSFGLKDRNPDSLEPLVLEAGTERYCFSGQIDRIDVDDKEGVALIIDYKRSSASSFNMAKFQEGHQPQALLYHLALERILKYKSMGIEYYALRSSKRSGFLKKSLYDQAKPTNRLKQKLSDEEFAELEQHLIQDLLKSVDAYKKGKIHTEAYSCKGCDYYGACRNENWTTNQ